MCRPQSPPPKRVVGEADRTALARQSCLSVPIAIHLRPSRTHGTEPVPWLFAHSPTPGGAAHNKRSGRKNESNHHKQECQRSLFDAPFGPALTYGAREQPGVSGLALPGTEVRQYQGRERPDPYDHKHYRPCPPESLDIPSPRHNQTYQNNRKGSNPREGEAVPWPYDGCQLSPYEAFGYGRSISAHCRREHEERDRKKDAGDSHRVATDFQFPPPLSLMAGPGYRPFRSTPGPTLTIS